jgi:hypothetical protein
VVTNSYFSSSKLWLHFYFPPVYLILLMASPRSISARSLASPERRYRRSAFNGAKQLSAAQAPNRRILVLLALLAFALVASIGVIVGVHLQTESEQAAGYPAAVIHPANR